MHYLILLVFGILFAMGSYLLMAQLFKIPTFKQTKAILNMGKTKKKQVKDSDAMILDVAMWVSKWIKLEEHKRKKISSVLTSAQISMTPETYVAQVYVKVLLSVVGIVPCLLIVPIFSPAFLIAGVGVYFTELGRAEKMIRQKREEIEQELPRFVATITQSLQGSKDIKGILESYRKNAGPSLKNELTITIADMGSGNYQAAFSRLDTRVSSGVLSQVVLGLQGVVNGADELAHFKMLSQQMKNEELQRLRKLAKERVPKIRKYSFFLLGCMIMLYLGIMGYQMIITMSGVL